MGEYPVIPFERDKHEAALFEFVEKVLGAEKFSSRGRALAWYHDSMPLRDRHPYRFVVVDGERVAGSMGHMPADYVIKGELVPVRITHDLLVDPDYRGKGIAKRLVTNSIQTGDFYPGGMWMNVPCHRIHLACGFDDVLAPSTQTLVLDPLGFVVRKELSILKKSAMRVALGLAERRARKRSTTTLKQMGGARAIDRVKEFEPRFDKDWLRMEKSYGIIAHRNASLLNWKYTNHPVLSYRILLATGTAGTLGYLVWRLPLEGAEERRAVIVDYLVEKRDADTLQHMLSKVIVDASEERVETVSILTTQPWALKVLRWFGFLPRHGRHTWVVAGWRDRIPSNWLQDHDPWHICLGDSDGDFWTGSQ
ncbi:MAG: GNAT family N-acetyltransferase [Candidatus Latescibacterota bacterium]|nr:MAG: GNAT family N-acetyltransferase [Candidatus Latescibacterota bacterium]